MIPAPFGDSQPEAARLAALTAVARISSVQTFLARYASTPLGEVFADQSWVSVFDECLGWLELPPEEFLSYARSAKRTPYDGLPEDPAVYRSDTTFLIAQAHRIWLTVQQLSRFVTDDPEFVVLDLGAYPFAIAEAVRNFLGRRCRIVGTVAQRLSAEAVRCLEAQGIELLPVNLDPRVKVAERLPGMTDYLPFPDDSVDLVVFAHVIEHLYHPIQALQEAARVLKPGGKLLLTTDNGMLLGGFLNYLNNGSYLHEPVQCTAAMVFNEWRGHVRFYTEGDLRTLLEAAGLKVMECHLREVLYNSVPEEYFREPALRIPRWRANLLSEFPNFRNEIQIWAEKGGPVGGDAGNPFDRLAAGADSQRLRDEFSRGVCDLSYTTWLDFLFAYRLFCGRWPTEAEMRRFAEAPPRRGVDELVQTMLGTKEFAARSLGVQLERPGPSCIIMTETEEGFRFFFSAQDTFVGFPVAVGVFEPDVRAALDRLVRPGMNCVDIGANIGYHAVRMGAAVRAGGGKVFCFEPDPFSFSLLVRNRAENRMEDVLVLFNVACGDENGEVELWKDPNPSNFGGAHTRKAGQPVVSRELIARVPLRRLDDLIPPEIAVHLVKMDVEGFEPLVLRGMRRLLEENRPILVCEFNVPALESLAAGASAAFLQELTELGYSLYEAGAFGRGEAAGFQYSGPACQFVNLVCLPAGKSPEDYRL
jgi:FkbM family methyltransferase